MISEVVTAAHQTLSAPTGTFDVIPAKYDVFPNLKEGSPMVVETTVPAPLSYAAIRDYAERVGDHHQIYDEHGRADIDLLVGRLGGVVEIADGRESLVVDEEGRFRIFLPTFTSARRDRFTQAHELGHYFLHYRLPRLVGAARYFRGGRSLAETQSNVFAASLLMPERAFRTAHRRLDADFYALARQFEVSPAAAEVRSQVLDLS